MTTIAAWPRRLAAACVLLSAGVPTWSQALAQASGSVGLPPPSSIVGTPYRAPDGSIVVGTPPPSAPAAAAPMPAPAQARPSAPRLPSSVQATVPPARPAAAASAEPRSGGVSGPDVFDDASCRAYAWLPGLSSEACRRDLKSLRAAVGAYKPPPAARAAPAPPRASAEAAPDPAPLADTAPAARAPAPAPAMPSAPSPPPSMAAEAPPSRAAAPHPAASGPDAYDDASCRAYAWLPAMSSDACRRDLKSLRETVAEKPHA